MVILIYVLFFVTALFALFPLQNKRVESVLFGIVGFVLFLTAGLRPSTSVPDYDVYEEMYVSVVNSGQVSFLVEPSFSVISLFVDRVFGQPVFLFLIYAALGVWLKFSAIKTLSKLWFLSLVLYFSTFFLLQEMVQIRAGIATGLILLSIKPLYERKLRPFLLIMIFAVLFHYSAIAALPLWFLPRQRRYHWFLWGIVPLGCILYLANVNLLNFVFPFPAIQARLQNSVDQQAAGVFDSVSVFGVAQIMRMALYYLLLCYHSRLVACNRYATLLLYIYAIGLFVIPAFGMVPVISVRLGDLFIAVEIILIPMLYYIIKPHILGRCVVVAIAFCHLLLALAIGERLVF